MGRWRTYTHRSGPGAQAPASGPPAVTGLSKRRHQWVVPQEDARGGDTLAWSCVCARRWRSGAKRDCRHRQGHVGRGAAGRDRRSCERRADREDARRSRPTATANTRSSTCGPASIRVTFTLTGFQTVKREGVELPADFTSTINADMKVGSLEEIGHRLRRRRRSSTCRTTVAHAGAQPRSASTRCRPAAPFRASASWLSASALSLPDTGGARAMQQTYMSTHGLSAANNTVMVDGMIVNGLQCDGAVQSYFNDAMNQEVSYQTQRHRRRDVRRRRAPEHDPERRRQPLQRTTSSGAIVRHSGRATTSRRACKAHGPEPIRQRDRPHHRLQRSRRADRS